jgi:hypothetical protein
MCSLLLLSFSKRWRDRVVAASKQRMQGVQALPSWLHSSPQQRRSTQPRDLAAFSEELGEVRGTLHATGNLAGRA